MNVVREMRLPAIPRREQQPTVESVRNVPVTLTPIPWGTRDKGLARAICRHVADIPTNHRTFRPFHFL
jgi:hypothetical protein